MRILSTIATAIGSACVATVIAQAIGVAYLWGSGGLSQEKVARILGVVYDIDMTARDDATGSNAAGDSEQPAHTEVIRRRVLKSLDLDLRETALDKAVGDLRALQAQLKSERERYDQLKQSFDTRLAELEGAATDTAIQELQQTLEAIQPKQAKDQILRMLDEDTAEGERSVMTDVVTIMKAMPLDKRRKILGEFKTEEEAERLHEILRQIRLGEPNESLIRNTREQLKGF